jgi:membrane protein YqaA with SNARE-associated domain
LKWLFRKIGNGLSAISQYLVTYGAFGLFTISLLDSAFIPLPGGPDAVIMLLSASQPAWTPLYVIAATSGSVLGCVILYCLSRKAGSRALSRFSEEKQARVKKWIDQYDVLSVLVASILPPPFPFKLFVITSGVFGLNLIRFAIAITIGRAFRFLLEGYLAATYGSEAKEIIARHYPKIGLGLALLIIAAFVIRNLFIKKKLTRSSFSL